MTPQADVFWAMVSQLKRIIVRYYRDGDEASHLYWRTYLQGYLNGAAMLLPYGSPLCLELMAAADELVSTFPMPDKASQVAWEKELDKELTP